MPVPLFAVTATWWSAVVPASISLPPRA